MPQRGKAKPEKKKAKPKKKKAKPEKATRARAASGKARAKPEKRAKATPKVAAKRKPAKAEAAKRSKPAVKRKPAKAARASRPKPASKRKPAKAKPASRPKRPARRARAAAPASPSGLQALIDRALATMNGGDLAVAAETFLEAADLDSTDWRLPNEAGVLYFRLERYADAIRCYERTLEIAPENVAAVMNLGLAHTLVGDDAAASAAFQRALLLDPIHAPAFFELGKLHQKAGEWGDALSAFDTALAHETMGTLFALSGAPPRNTRLIALAMLNKARIFFRLGRGDDGVAQAGTLWEAVKADELILKLASELSVGGDAVHARRVLEALLAVAPSHAAAREQLRALD